MPRSYATTSTAGGGGGGTPGSPDASVQYNNGGSFGGSLLNYNDSETTVATFKSKGSEVGSIDGIGLSLSSGTGGTTGGNSGSLNLAAADGAFGTGGAVTLTSGDGGLFYGLISSAEPDTAGSGYAVNDIVTVVGGDSNGTLRVDSISFGGHVTALSVVNPGSGYTAGLFPTTGAGDDTLTVSLGVGVDASAGDFTITTGTAREVGQTPGTLRISTKNATGDNNGGNIFIRSASAGDIGNAGFISITSGNGGTTSGDGGNFVFQAGSAYFFGSGGNGGNFVLLPGFGVGGGQNGKVKLGDPISGVTASLITTFLTGDRIYTFPDQSGTFVIVLESIALTAQTANISDTSFIVSDPGLYRITYSLFDTTADITAGAVTLNIKFTDDATSRTVSSSPVVLTSLSGFTQGTIIARVASGSLTYGVTHTGIFGSADYALYISQEKLQ